LPSHARTKSSQTKRYGFFPGCVAKESCKELFNSTMLLADKLGIELIELTAASCCGASVLNDVNRDVARVLNARTYAQAEALGLDDVITICSTCTGHMRAANKELVESEERMTQANAILGKFGARYDGSVTVRHLLWLLIDDIGLDRLSSMVVRPLNGLKVAPFYGCHIIPSRKRERLGSRRSTAFARGSHPAIGGQPVDTLGKRGACGFHVQLEKDGIAPAMVGQNMRMAKDNGPKRSSRRARSAISRSTDIRPTRRRAGVAPISRRFICRSSSRSRSACPPRSSGSTSTSSIRAMRWWREN